MVLGDSWDGADTCPKSYELRRPTFLITIGSFQACYLINNRFEGRPRNYAIKAK